MTTPRGQMQPDDQDDPAVQAEWRRLERERLAEERAEAREDADEAAHEPTVVRAERRWQPLAFAIALAAGSLAAFLVNRPRTTVTTEESQAQAVREALKSWSDSIPDDAQTAAGPRLKRAASSAVLPPDRLRIRVGLRDDQSRERLESLLAASGLRIEGDLDTAVEEAAAAGGAVAAERLAVSGRPAAVDALLDALAASAAVLALEGQGVFAEVAAEPPAEPAAESTGQAPAELPPEPPARVRLVIEIAEVVPEPAS